MNKLTDWLKTWHANRARTDKAPFKGIGNVRCIAITCYSWNSATASDNGWEKKAALLTGSPGIGKTTMAHLVCHELGYEV